MAAERAFATTLNDARGYRIENGELVLTILAARTRPFPPDQLAFVLRRRRRRDLHCWHLARQRSN